MSEEDNPLETFEPNTNLLYAFITLFLIGFGLLTFSTVMAYSPFLMDTFLTFTNIELGFISFLICLLSSTILTVDTSRREEDSYFSRLRLISGVIFFTTILLFLLTWVIIYPVEGYYGNGNDGASYTIESWLQVSFWVNFGINMMFLAVEKYNEFFAQ